MFSISFKSLPAVAKLETRVTDRPLARLLRKANGFSRIIGLTVAANLALGLGTANATDFLTEDWESGTPPAGWPCKSAPSTCARSSFNGWGNIVADYCPDAAYWSSTGVSTARSHSGTKSFYTYRQGSNDYSCDIQKSWTATPTKAYVRMYIYLPSSAWTGFNTPTTKEPYVHLFFWNTAFSMTGPRVNIFAKVPYVTSYACGAGRGGIPANQPYAFFNVQDYDKDWDSGSFPNGCYNLMQHLDEWISVEFMFDSTNTNRSSRQVSIWINGTLTYTGTNRLTDDNYRNLILSNYMSVSGQTPNDTAIYYDDIIVSDTYIGPTRMPGSAPLPAPPPAPGGLNAAGRP
jgi:hypothetical protein